MIIKVKNISELILVIAAMILNLIIILRPPTDSDAGPMFAYNFLFFIPMTLSAGLLSLISIIIVITKWIQKKRTNKIIKIISLVLSIPILIYSIRIFTYFFFPQDIDFPEYELIPDPVYNSSDSIKIDSEKTMHFVGYNWGKKLKKRRLYISLTPYECDTFTIVETYCCQGDSLMTIYYQEDNDSLFVYVPQDCNVYTHHGAKYRDMIRAKTIKISYKKIDSLLLKDKNSKIKKYDWK